MTQDDYDSFMRDAFKVTSILNKYGKDNVEDVKNSPETRLKMEINMEYDEFDEACRRFLEYQPLELDAGADEAAETQNDKEI